MDWTLEFWVGLLDRSHEVTEIRHAELLKTRPMSAHELSTPSAGNHLKQTTLEPNLLEGHDFLAQQKDDRGLTAALADHTEIGSHDTARNNQCKQTAQPTEQRVALSRSMSVR